MKNIVLIFFSTFALFSALALGDGHGDDSETPTAVANTINFCSLKDGKTMADTEKVMSMLASWAEQNNPGLVAVLTPFYRTGGREYGDLMIQSFNSYEQLPALQASWENSGQKIQAAMDKVLDCEVALMNYYSSYTHPDLQGSKDSFYGVAMCVPNEGTTPEKIGMAQAQRSKAAEEANVRIHMALMFPGMGTRALPEGYGRVTTWADMEALATSGNWWANEGGWKTGQTYSKNVAECSDMNLYRVNVLKQFSSDT